MAPRTLLRITGRLLGAGLLVVGVSACGEPEDTDTLCDREVPLTYRNFGQPLMDQYCTGCHSSIASPLQRQGAPEGINVDTYEGVLRFAERIEARVLVEHRKPEEADRDPMPPGGGLTTEDLDMLEEWLTCSVYDDKARWEAR